MLSNQLQMLNLTPAVDDHHRKAVCKKKEKTDLINNSMKNEMPQDKHFRMSQKKDQSEPLSGRSLEMNPH